MKYMEYLGGVALAGLLLLPASHICQGQERRRSHALRPGAGRLDLARSRAITKSSGMAPGPTVNVDFLRDHKTVATTSAKLVAYTSGSDAFVTEPASWQVPERDA